MSDDKKRPCRLVKDLDHGIECPVARSMAEAMAHQHQAEEPGTRSGGPAQVATKQYRSNFETIFGAKSTVGEA